MSSESSEQIPELDPDRIDYNNQKVYQNTFINEETRYLSVLEMLVNFRRKSQIPFDDQSTTNRKR